jgi:hypothetical protein
MFLNFENGVFQMKSKQTIVEFTAPINMQDAGYKIARLGETSKSIAQYVIEQSPSFPETIEEKVKTDLYAGFTLRHNEVIGSTFYIMGEMGDYLPINEKDIAKYQGKKEIVEMNPIIAMAYTGTEFGMLANSKSNAYNKPLHTIVGAMRDKFKGYASNAMKRLVSSAKEIKNGDKPRVRNGNDNFVMAVTKVFEGLEKRARNAEKKGDDSASFARHAVAVKAYWESYNKK